MDTLLLWERALDVLYPPTCLSCHADGVWFCEACSSQMKFFEAGFGAVPPFASITSVASYADPRWRTLVTSFKYKAASCLYPVFVDQVRRFREGFGEAWPWAGYSDMIIAPIPTDASRVRARGMDHAHVITHLVHQLLVPWATPKLVLSRTQKAPPNAQLPPDATRRANVKGLFQAQGSIELPILLIDDVFTTGATATEATHILRGAGAPEVHVFTLAKG